MRDLRVWVDGNSNGVILRRIPHGVPAVWR